MLVLKIRFWSLSVWSIRIWNKRFNLCIRIERKFEIILLRKITVSKFNLCGLWLLFDIWRNWIIRDFNLFFNVLFRSLRVNLLIRLTIAIDNVIHVVAKITLFTPNNNIHNFVDKNRNLNLYYLWNWHFDLILNFLSLTKFLWICYLWFWNKTLKIAYFTNYTLFFLFHLRKFLLTLLAPRILLDGKRIKVTS